MVRALVVVVIVALWAVAAEGAASGQMTQHYDATADEAHPVTRLLSSPVCPSSASGAHLCFPVGDSTLSFAVAIDDDLHLGDVFAVVTFERPDGEYAGTFFVCGHGVVDGFGSATFVSVDLYTGVSADPMCDGREYPDTEVIGPATTGSVTLTPG